MWGHQLNHGPSTHGQWWKATEEPGGSTAQVSSESLAKLHTAETIPTSLLSAKLPLF